jgi:hypothetical protein
MKKLLILFLVISANLVQAQDSVLLRLNYEKGATYGVTMDMSQDMGAVMSMGMTINMDIKVLDVTEDTYNSEMKFSKISMDMLQGGQTMSFDSTQSVDELDEMGKKIKSQMDPMLKAVVYAKGNNLGEVLEARVEPNVIGMEDLANQSSNVVYPKEALKVGSTWSTSKDQKGMVMDYIYTVKSISKENVVLDLSGKVSGMAAGTISGSIIIERASGIPVDSKINMDMSVSGQDMKTKVSMVMAKK